jgi:hypothetical protein
MCLLYTQAKDVKAQKHVYTSVDIPLELGRKVFVATTKHSEYIASLRSIGVGITDENKAILCSNAREVQKQSHLNVTRVMQVQGPF